MHLSVTFLLLLVAAPSPTPALQFGQMAGLIDGASVACHIAKATPPKSVADTIHRLSVTLTDYSAAVAAYAEAQGAMARWLVDGAHTEICPLFYALIHMLHENAGDHSAPPPSRDKTAQSPPTTSNEAEGF